VTFMPGPISSGPLFGRLGPKRTDLGAVTDFKAPSKPPPGRNSFLFSVASGGGGRPRSESLPTGAPGTGFGRARSVTSLDVPSKPPGPTRRNISSSGVSKNVFSDFKSMFAELFPSRPGVPPTKRDEQLGQPAVQSVRAAEPPDAEPDSSWTAEMQDGMSLRPSKFNVWRNGSEAPEKLFAEGLPPRGTNFSVQDHVNNFKTVNTVSDSAYYGSSVAASSVGDEGKHDQGPLYGTGRYVSYLVDVWGVPSGQQPGGASVVEWETLVHRAPSRKVAVVLVS
jgi:hypothetical protein